MIKIVLICIYAFIGCIAVLFIARIHKRNAVTGSAINDAQNRDFIDDLSSFRRSKLAEKPWNMSYETYVTIGAVCSIIFSIIGYLYSGIPVAVAAAVIGQLVPEVIVRFQSATQRQRFEERYARSLRQLSSALKSGMSLPLAIEDVCHSPFVHDSVRIEFQQLSADLKLGVPIQDAFLKFYDRVKFSDAEDVAIAIGMQAKVGGREGAVVETIARNISDRMMLRKEINSMFAGSSVTVLVLDILPFAIVGFLFVGASDFMSMYLESTSMFLLLISMLVFMGIGSIVTHGMVIKMKRECGVGDQ